MGDLAQQYRLEWADPEGSTPDQKIDAANRKLRQMFAQTDEMFQTLFDRSKISEDAAEPDFLVQQVFE